ncbi:transcriptional regulator GcvA [Opacimonas viscosa]|uniref:Transcriptional regulator GcvA n=1 Tax=Opacimonas viscosa TaxID=2961944 RepID=A0AA42BKD2_9ALTE|nr:transcriptional regulator GcvA [Opacimonas viscosa]MCP3427643.1 transcriptional regulator GcvA [Opacimonas viscosa]
MRKRYPPLNALRAFEAAAKHLSFTKAADELFVTQAAISHQIKLLEDYLHMKLFLRKNRTLLLTEEGQAYYLDIKEIFAHIHDATEKLMSKGAKGAITIGMPASFASQWLVPRINLFTALYPDIDVRIKAVDFDENYLDESIDVAVYYGRGRWANLHSTKLQTETLTPLCSPLLLQGEKALNCLDDLAKHTLLHDASRSVWKQWLSHFKLTHINVNQGPIFSHSMLVLQAAALGQGIALGNTLLAKPDLDSGRLIAPFAESYDAKDGFYLVSEAAFADQEKITIFREWIVQQIESEEHANA